jgi:hypothetical protein
MALKPLYIEGKGQKGEHFQGSPGVYFLFVGLSLIWCHIASTRFFVAASIFISSGQRPV